MSLPPPRRGRKEKQMTETILNKTPAKSADLGEETLKAIEERCEAATPGPWRTEDCYSGVTTNVVCADRRTHGYGCGNDFICDLNDGEYHAYMSIGEQKANAEFIAHAREDLPRLLAAYRELKSENERLKTAVYLVHVSGQRQDRRICENVPGSTHTGPAGEGGSKVRRTVMNDDCTNVILTVKSTSGIQDEMDALHNENARLTAALAASQRRESAAVEDLKREDNCDICKHGQNAPDGCNLMCSICKLPCMCNDCRDEDKWQWRGPSDGEAHHDA